MNYRFSSKMAGILLLTLLVSLLVIPQGVIASSVSAIGSPVLAQLQQITNQPALESVVTFSGNNAQGAGYIPGETVHVDVRGPNAEIYSCDAKVDLSGAWSCSVNLWEDNPVTGIFYYKATGLKSGVSYTGSFNNEGAIKSVTLIVDGEQLTEKAVIHPGMSMDVKIELESTKSNFSWSATKYQIQQKACMSEPACTWKTVFTSPCLSAPEPDLKGKLPHLFVTISDVFKQTQVNTSYQLMATTYSDADCKLVNGEQWYYAKEFEVKNYETTTGLDCTPATNSSGDMFDCKATVTGITGKDKNPMGTVSFEIEKAGVGMVTPSACFLKAERNGVASCSTSFQYKTNGIFNLRANFISSDPFVDGSTSAWKSVVFDLQTPVVTVTANAVTKKYGETDPVLTFSTSPDNLYAIFSGSLTRTAGEDAGSYNISQGTLTADGYTIKFIPATLTIQKAKANIQVSGFNGVYDGKPHGVTGTATGVRGEDLSSLLKLGPEFVDVPGGNSTLQFAGTKNYQAETIQNVPVVISARELEITADVLSKIYGTPDPIFSYKITKGNLVDGDKLTGEISREPNEAAGMQMLTRGSLSAGDNYHISYVSAWFKINKRPLTVTANPQSKAVGASEPALTFMITNGQLVDGDFFSGSLVRTPGESTGTYPIGQGSLYLSENYELNFEGSTFTIYDSASGLDVDFDGIIDAADNCVFKSNKDQKDTDNDGFGDICDTTPMNLQANMVVPVTGSSNSSALNCAGSTTLSLENGNLVVIPRELCKWSAIVGIEPEISLPAVLPTATNYISTFNLFLIKNQTIMDVTENKAGMDYSFRIPASAQNAKLVILYWDAKAKAGLGNWVELPACPFRSPVSLNKSDTEDKRLVLNCSLPANRKIIDFSTNFPGLFVLVSR